MANYRRARFHASDLCSIRGERFPRAVGAGSGDIGKVETSRRGQSIESQIPGNPEESSDAFRLLVGHLTKNLLAESHHTLFPARERFLSLDVIAVA